ncbi:MAG TPA: FTR1 family protein [Gammaproteobacteria bacterium]|jgi:high-affinity iron transporter|nr:FTR1 family protein [Gammaproteobacteria bacterium]
MLATAIVVFREVIEAALIVAIVLGASRGIIGRGRWVSAGILLGVTGAALVAVFAGVINDSFSGNGQAFLNAGILLAAVGMLGWHNIWMSSHGRSLAADVKEVGYAVQSGSRPLTALMIITLVAVMREGSEVVLFLWAFATGGMSGMSMLAGGFVGLVAGVLMGVGLYLGLLRIPMRHFFSVTGWLVLLIAAGLAAQAASFLNQAGVLPALGNSLWDTSGILSQGSLVGQMLHVMVGYTARPSGIQLLFYVVTLFTILTLMHWVGRHHRSRAPARAS